MPSLFILCIQINSMSLFLINVRKFITGNGFCTTLKKENHWVDPNKHRNHEIQFMQKMFWWAKIRELICISNI